jgi:hypothetical protein
MDYLIGISVLFVLACGCIIVECCECDCNCSDDINNDIQISNVTTPVHDDDDHIEI